MNEEITTTTGDQLDLIKRTVAKGATNDELQLFLYTARKTGLDPLTKQIYCIKRKSKDGEDTMAIQTGIDGYRTIADRTGKYAGNDDPVFDSEAKPRKATVTVYKLVEGVRCAFTATSRWDQYYPGDGKAGFFWRRMPHLMLGKTAEALALRKAFPQDLSGIYVKEEMDQADREEESEPSRRIADRSYELTNAKTLKEEEEEEEEKEWGEMTWICNILDVTEIKPEGKNYTVFTIVTDHRVPKQPRTIKRDLATAIGEFIGTGLVELKVKPGRFKDTWEAINIQAREEPPTLEEEFAQKEHDATS